MTADASLSGEAVTRRIKAHVKENWLHQFDIDDEGRISSAENFQYRRRILEGVFGTLFLDRSVLVLDEASGIYPALISRAGARAVAASSASESTCELIRDVVEFLEAPAEIVNSQMVGFYDSEPYADMQYSASYDFLLVLGQIWSMFRASSGSFEAVTEACAAVVTDGLVFDWTDAEWASPPPPPNYDRAEFCRALARNFEYVTCYSDWLVVAVGALPPATGEATAPS
jgi:hypothetical protein